MTNKQRIRFLLTAICLVIVAFPSFTLSAKTLTIDSEEQFRFALEAMEKGEYQRAVTEFRRFMGFFPKDKLVPKAHYLIGVCYLKGKKFDKARKVLNEVYKTYTDHPVAGEALFMIGESYYRQGIPKEAIYYFEKIPKQFSRPGLKNRAIYRLAWSRMQANQWQTASGDFKKVDKSSPLYGTAQELSARSLEGETLPYKSPATAGTLAALLPGLGHAYNDRYRDGVVAFLLNGLFIWAAVESFDNDNDVLGGILTFLEVGWYSGNIYGAVNAAHKRNRKIRMDFRQKLPDPLKINLSSKDEGKYLGLALNFEF